MAREVIDHMAWYTLAKVQSYLTNHIRPIILYHIICIIIIYVTYLTNHIRPIIFASKGDLADAPTPQISDLMLYRLALLNVNLTFLLYFHCNLQSSGEGGCWSVWGVPLPQ